MMKRPMETLLRDVRRKKKKKKQQKSDLARRLAEAPQDAVVYGVNQVFREVSRLRIVGVIDDGVPTRHLQQAAARLDVPIVVLPSEIKHTAIGLRPRTNPDPAYEDLAAYLFRVHAQQKP